MALRAKDIAEMLGVSTAAVSLVINNKPGVGEQKRQEIIEKIKELGCEYMLKESPSSKSNIGFVVYKKSGKLIDESPFFTYILEGITERINKYGYHLNFVYLNSQMSEETLKNHLLSGNYDGFLIFGVEMKREDLQIFIDTGIPFSILDNAFRENDVDSVAINNVQGTSKAIQHLYDMGHRRIGYIRCKTRINSFEERFCEYDLWLKHLGLEIPADGIIDVGYSESEIRKDIHHYLSMNPELPTAFFAENDYLGCNCLLQFQEHGYQIPDDISMIGFDDRPICQMVQPKLTTINVPKNIFGPSAVDLLMSRINDKRTHSLKVEIGTNLIIRNSVKNIGTL